MCTFYSASTEAFATLPTRHATFTFATLPTLHATFAALDQMYIHDTKASILDIGAMTSIVQGTQGTGPRVQLVDVTGDNINADGRRDVSSPYGHGRALYCRYYWIPARIYFVRGRNERLLSP
jgi:hypothetical protein